ncbi:MAG: hypothetical protein ACE5L6_03980 [Candidatus Bathyarchaeia archaeon]
MKIDWVRVAELAVTVLSLLVFSILVVTHEFPAFQYATSTEGLVKIDMSKIGLEVSQFLWTHRLLDLIAQAFVLFVAAACCVAILRVQEKE